MTLPSDYIERGWCQKAMARSAENRSVGEHSPRAVSWCLWGAFMQPDCRQINGQRWRYGYCNLLVVRALFRGRTSLAAPRLRSWTCCDAPKPPCWGWCMKRLTKADFRAMKIFNSHGILSRGRAKVYIAYMARTTGLGGMPPKVLVVGNGFHTDPDAHFLDHGCKAFLPFGHGGETWRENRDLAIKSAQEWCRDRYGILEWERDPWGNWQPKGTIEQAASGEVTHGR